MEEDEGRWVMKVDVPLIPCGVDFDGKVKPIDELSWNCKPSRMKRFLKWFTTPHPDLEWFHRLPWPLKILVGVPFTIACAFALVVFIVSFLWLVGLVGIMA